MSDEARFCLGCEDIVRESDVASGLPLTTHYHSHHVRQMADGSTSRCGDAFTLEELKMCVLECETALGRAEAECRGMSRRLASFESYLRWKKLADTAGQRS